LVSVLRARYPTITSVAQLTSLNLQKWQQLITSPNVTVPDSIEGTTPAEKASNYAASMIAILKEALPGTYFITDLQGSIAGSTDPVDQDVGTFLMNASNFDILNTNLNAYIAQNSQTVFNGIASAGQSAVTAKLAAWQRLARITPDFSTANTLVSQRLTSAYEIAATPRSSFIQKFAGPLGGSEQAATVYARAQQIASSAATLLSNIRYGLSVPRTRAIGDVAKQVANLLNPSSPPSSG
jgi:hypothetical protein